MSPAVSLEGARGADPAGVRLNTALVRYRFEFLIYFPPSATLIEPP